MLSRNSIKLLTIFPITESFRRGLFPYSTRAFIATYTTERIQPAHVLSDAFSLCFVLRIRFTVTLLKFHSRSNRSGVIVPIETFVGLKVYRKTKDFSSRTGTFFAMK